MTDAGSGMRRLGCPTAAVVLALACAAASAPSYAQSAAAPEISQADFQAIVECLARGDEIVMAPKLDCVARTTGDDIVEKANMPLGKIDWSGDWNSVCQDKNDGRRLPSDIIKRIAAHNDVRPAPTGIRSSRER